MEKSDFEVKITAYIAAGVVLFLLLNLWWFKIKGIYIDTYTTLLVFALLGLILLPYMSKLKIGSMLEFERRFENKIKDVKNIQYLREIIKSPSGDLAFYDSEGKHPVPDKETADFLKSNKGEIQVSQEEFDKMPVSYQIDSVLTSRIVEWKGHVFVILNNKKFHVGSASFLADWNRPTPYEQILDEEIKSFPTGR